jgi:hypothetical protein
MAVKATKPGQAASTVRAKKTAGLRSLTANQVIAHNVEAARQRKHWTQLKTVKQLRRFGIRWGRTAYAMAVSASAKGGHVREFSADEILAFAQCFGIAIWRLFIPPPDTMVTLPGGGPTLDLNAMRHFAYRITELPAPKTRQEAELQKEVQKEVQRNTVDYLLQQLDIDPASIRVISSKVFRNPAAFSRALIKKRSSES